MTARWTGRPFPTGLHCSSLKEDSLMWPWYTARMSACKIFARPSMVQALSSVTPLLRQAMLMQSVLNINLRNVRPRCTGFWSLKQPPRIRLSNGGSIVYANEIQPESRLLFVNLCPNEDCKRYVLLRICSSHVSRFGFPFEQFDSAIIKLLLLSEKISVFWYRQTKTA